jgi:hypothetical protein
MLSQIYVALLIAATITLAALPLISRTFQLPRGRHHAGRVITQAREDMAADFWLRELTPGRSLAGLRLRRDLRRWIPRERRLP